MYIETDSILTINAGKTTLSVKAIGKSFLKIYNNNTLIESSHELAKNK
ncbi:MAG: hypothetical protein ACLU81_02200 [Lachnospira eligens]